MTQHKGQEIFYMSCMLGSYGAKRVALAQYFSCGEKTTERY